MVELVESTRQTVHLAVLDGSDVLYIEKLYGHLAVTAPSYVGGRVPARCAAIGKAMLAFSGDEVVEQAITGPLERRTRHTTVDRRVLRDELTRIADDGVAYDHEEVRLGLTCVGAPIIRRDGTIAAISIAGPTSQFEPERAAKNLARVASQITAQLGG
jgi:DNA-binding IclR family transcriptional regulator